ncbi:MAG: hypothetical protein ACRDLS_01155 [Solirubrobacteraceae bacterium]
MSDEAAEVLNGTPVLAGPEAHYVESPRPPGALTPAVVQTAAVVGASAVAGATVVALLRRRRMRKMARRKGRMLAPVLASRSFLVDVHVLGERK